MKYEIEYVKIGDIIPYEKNAKRHPKEQIECIKKSIQEFGFKQNLVIDDDNVLIIGHGRLQAAKELGTFDALPCVRASDLTPEQIKALRLADNKVAESEWDFDLLDESLSEISDIDMSDFGFDLDDDEEETNVEIEEDEVPKEVETRCKLGDLYEVGGA